MYIHNPPLTWKGNKIIRGKREKYKMEEKKPDRETKGSEKLKVEEKKQRK